MSGQEYFKKGLSDFTYEAASGGAIRHLADLGYTAGQIAKRLDFPAPYERVQKTVWEHFCDTGILLLAEPGSGKRREKAVYVRDYDKYGRTSFRRTVQSGSIEPVCWQERHFSESADGSFAVFLEKKCAQNGEDTAYISCDFGLRARDEPAAFMESLQKLEERQRDYILGLPWERELCCHRLNQRMREIAVRLYEGGGYHGTCYFMKTAEKVMI